MIKIHSLDVILLVIHTHIHTYIQHTRVQECLHPENMSLGDGKVLYKMLTEVIMEVTFIFLYISAFPIMNFA